MMAGIVTLIDAQARDWGGTSDNLADSSDRKERKTFDGCFEVSLEHAHTARCLRLICRYC
jgi:hypothetical protein